MRRRRTQSQTGKIFRRRGPSLQIWNGHRSLLSRKIGIQLPLVEWNKEQVLNERWGGSAGTHLSCYWDLAAPAAMRSCVERAEAFARIGKPIRSRHDL